MEQCRNVSAIKKRIEDEHQFSIQRNATKLLECFAQTEYLVMGFGPGMIRGYDEFAKTIKAGFEKNPQPLQLTGVVSDHRIRQQGNTAFVTSITTSTRPDGTQLQTNKAQYLEKLNGDWKIVGNLYRNVPITKPK